MRVYIFEYIGTRVVCEYFGKRTGRREIFQRRLSLSSEGKMFLRRWQDERISGTRQQTPGPRMSWVVARRVVHVRGTDQTTRHHRRLLLRKESRKTPNTFFFAPTRKTTRDGLAATWYFPSPYSPAPSFSLYSSRGLVFSFRRLVVVVS